MTDFRCTILLRCCLCLMWLGLGVQSVSGQSDFPMIVEIQDGSNRVRSGGCLPLSLRVNWAGPGSIINGDLQIRISDGYDMQLGTCVLEDLYLSQGEQVLDLLVPMNADSQFTSQLELEMVFQETSGTRHRLPSRQLILGQAGRRTLILGMGVSDGSNQTRHDLEIALGFERFIPKEPQNQSLNRSAVLTRSRQLSPGSFPTLPLSLCVYDVLLLDAEFFVELSAQQSRALVAWVRAGGSLCLLLPQSSTVVSATFSADQIDSLNELFAGSTAGSSFSKSTTGKLRSHNENSSAVHKAHFGLGRVVAGGFDVTQAATQLQAATWNEPLAFLWKFREDQLQPIGNTSNVDWEIATRLHNKHVEHGGAFEHVRPESLLPVPRGGGAGLLEKTLPLGMSVIPLWLMGIVLMLYIWAIGPSDYLLLGLFKARFYTWFLFPTVTVLFTVAAIWLSNSYMSGSTPGGSVTIHDVTEGGVIARTHDIKLQFNGKHRTVETPLNQELFIPLNHHQMGINNIYQLRQMQRTDARKSAPLYYGQLPNRGRVLQSISPWTPQLNRTLRIPSQPMQAPGNFDWDAPLGDAGRTQLIQRIQSAFGNVQAKVYHRDGFRDSEDESTLQHEVTLLGSPELFTSHHEYTRRRVRRNRGMDYTHVLTDFIHVSTVCESGGLFSIVSQISPKCDGYLEDLPLLDSSDEGTFVLIIAIRDQNNWTIYRKLYREA